MFSSNTSQVVTATQAEAIDFDGTNDYLRRTSDLTGNTTSKTFTFSTWIWQGNTSTNYMYVVSDGTNQRFVVRVVNNGTVSVEGTGNTNSVILQVTAPLATAPRTNTFYHILISMNMANAANRSIYINDIAQSLTVTTYTNAVIPFNQVDHVVAGTEGGSAGDLGRLSNVFLDYTYRDMSITANRRLFVTADLKPAAGQAALNPILYLPMSNPTTVGTNSGTGGNFTLTGTIARSGRGPNQYNAPYSTFNGSTQYLNKATSALGSDSYQVTFSCSFKYTTAATRYIMARGNATAGDDNQVRIRVTSTGGLAVLFANGTDSSQNQQVVFTLPTDTLFLNRNYVLTFSFDSQDSSKRWVYINGINYTSSVTWTTYRSTAIINFSYTNFNTTIGSSGAASYFIGQIGALWFNSTYIDLSVASNLAKFVSGTGIDAKPVDLGATGELPTGTSPLIYLPMYGNNAGKNYGTGGDFTVNSGPYTGARGPNEFWGNKANFGASSSNYLSKSTALVGNPGSVTTATFCCYFYCDNSASTGTLFGFNSAGSGTWQISYNNLFVWLGSGYVQFNENVSQNVWHSLLFSRTGSTITAYLDGVALTINSGSSFSYGGAINFASTPVNIGVRSNGASQTEPVNGQISELYLSSSYIDFSLEANRLKFRDAFGNPVDLSAQITAQSIPNPIIYARFPPTSFGTNSGTGGNFTVSGTITDGGQL